MEELAEVQAERDEWKFMYKNCVRYRDRLVDTFTLMADEYRVVVHLPGVESDQRWLGTSERLAEVEAGYLRRVYRRDPDVRITIESRKVGEWSDAT